MSGCCVLCVDQASSCCQRSQAPPEEQVRGTGASAWHQNASILLRSQEDSNVGMLRFYTCRTEGAPSEAIFYGLYIY